MPRFPRRQAEVIALADAMIAGYTANPADFPNADLPALQAARGAYQTGRDAQTEAMGQAQLKTDVKDEKLDDLEDVMKNQLKQSDVDTTADPEKLGLIGSGPKAPGQPSNPPRQPRALDPVIQGPGTVFLDWKEPGQTMFRIHNLGDEDREYSDASPFGANLWVRRAVFDCGRRYDEHIGPRPGSYKMGSETSFLMQLFTDGFAAFYVHNACVGHHVQLALLSEKGLAGRFVRSGRGIVPRSGINRPELHSKSEVRWYLRTSIAIACSYFRLLVARLLIVRAQRIERMVFAARCLGYDLESLRAVWHENVQKME